MQTTPHSGSYTELTTPSSSENKSNSEIDIETQQTDLTESTGCSFTDHTSYQLKYAMTFFAVICAVISECITNFYSFNESPNTIDTKSAFLALTVVSNFLYALLPTQTNPENENDQWYEKKKFYSKIGTHFLSTSIAVFEGMSFFSRNQYLPAITTTSALTTTASQIADVIADKFYFGR